MSFVLVVSCRELAIIRSCVESSADLVSGSKNSHQKLAEELTELAEELKSRPMEMSLRKVNEVK